MVDETAAKRWLRLNIAFEHFQHFIANKRNRFDLTIIDLLFVSNFKGGNASITESTSSISQKLQTYSLHLRQMHEAIDGLTLAMFDDAKFERVKGLACHCLKLTAKNSPFKISGFGPSYASALMSAFFPDAVPVIDRRVLNGAKIAVELDSQRQVKDIEDHYPKLFDRCRTAQAD